MNPKLRPAACCSAGILMHASPSRMIVEKMPGITLEGIDEPVSAYIVKGFPES
jgi:hypothetical protein